jgi:hypothetical protein
MSIKLPLILSIVAVVFKGRADLVAENMALRHQLSCMSNRKARPRLRPLDRVFWVLLSSFWCGWRESLAMVKPATVLAWHLCLVNIPYCSVTVELILPMGMWVSFAGCPSSSR